MDHRPFMPTRGESMEQVYFKRYRMEISLCDREFPLDTPPPGYSILPWHTALLRAHAEAKYRSFRDEIDANVFPCLGRPDGCHQLMVDISQRENFVPQATWLLVYQPPSHLAPSYCGTIQGLRDEAGYGAVQNLGVAPLHRGKGLGMRLLCQAMCGFQSVGLKRAYLEVTAENHHALRLYRRLGFREVKTVYKAVEVSYA